MGKLKARGVLGSDGRITIKDSIRKGLGLKEGTFWQMEVYGKDKILITFFKH